MPALEEVPAYGCWSKRWRMNGMVSALGSVSARPGVRGGDIKKAFTLLALAIILTSAIGGGCGGPSVRSLIKNLGMHKDDDVREEAIEELVNIGEPAVESLINALGDEDQVVRSLAAKTLGEIGDSRAVEPLIRALGHEHELVRAGAATALIKLGEPAVTSLIEALGDENFNVRANAAMALGDIGDRQAVELLIQALQDEDWRVRCAAAYALGEIVSRPN